MLVNSNVYKQTSEPHTWSMWFKLEMRKPFPDG